MLTLTHLARSLRLLPRFIKRSTFAPRFFSISTTPSISHAETPAGPAAASQPVVASMSSVATAPLSSNPNPHSAVCGIDEAGRGAVIGPLVIGACALTPQQETFLKQAGVRDSKALSPLQRERLEQIIKDNCIAWRTLHIEAHEIDQQRANKINLNEIEYRAMVHLLKSIRYSHAQESKRFNTAEVIDRLQIDSVENNAPKLQQRYQTEFPSDVQIVCENKADSKYIAVAAASILAKVERDRRIAELQAKLQVRIGSGYPHDVVTKSFVRGVHARRSLGEKELPYVRYSWSVNLGDTEKPVEKSNDLTKEAISPVSIPAPVAPVQVVQPSPETLVATAEIPAKLKSPVFNAHAVDIVQTPSVSHIAFPSSSVADAGFVPVSEPIPMPTPPALKLKSFSSTRTGFTVKKAKSAAAAPSTNISSIPSDLRSHFDKIITE